MAQRIAVVNCPSNETLALLDLIFVIFIGIPVSIGMLTLMVTQLKKREKE